MSRYLFTGLIIITVAFFGCKKEKLTWSQAEKIESYTDSRLNKILFSTSGKGVMWQTYCAYNWSAKVNHYSLR